MTDSKKHSSIGASSAERWMNCAGSVWLCEQAPPAPTSKYAAEGTKAHEIAEKAVNGVELWDLVGEGVTKEMLEGAQLYRDFIHGHDDAKIFTEQEVSLPKLDDRAFGTADCIIVRETDIKIVDYKFGAGYAVEVEDNPQLMYYALAALKFAGRRVDTVGMAIVQPRALHEHGPIRQTHLSKRDLLAWGRKVLKPAMDRTRWRDAPVVPGKWCRWCPAITLCPEQGHLPVKVAAEVEFAEHPLKALPVVKGLTPEQIGIAMNAQAAIEEWFSQVRGQAKSLLESGTEVPGYKLVKGRTTRSWRDETEAAKFLGKYLADKAYTTKVISPAQATKLLDVPSFLIEETVDNSSIAEVNDRRKSVPRSLITDFQME